MIVYLIRNKANGKCYVGKSTRDLHTRWLEHIRHGRNGRPGALYFDLQMMGAEFFELRILFESTQESEIAAMERHFITLFQCVESGYNTAAQSYGGNYSHHRNARAKLSKTHRARIAQRVGKVWAERKRVTKCA